MKNLHTYTSSNSRAFVLPTVIVLSVVLLTLGLSVFQLTSSIARSLTDQYWQKMSKQAAQAGVSYVSACIDQGLSGSTWPSTVITQNDTCVGVPTGTQPSVYTNTGETNPIPSKYKSSFNIFKPTTGVDGIPKARVEGIVDVLNSAGTTTIKTYKTDMTVIINGPTRATTQLALGRKHTCALSDGQVFCWGSNSVNPYAGGSTDNTVRGQLGDGSTVSSRSTASAVSTTGVLNGKNVTKIAAGHNFTCALASGKVYCWGDGAGGQLGNGTNGSGVYSNVPVAVSTSGQLSGKTVTDITAGYDFVCAVAGDMSSGIGRVYCWGQGSYGQMGNGSNSNTNTPASPATGSIATLNATSVSAGANHVCAIAGNTTSSQVYCWGRGTEGQLGRGSNSNANTPAAMNPVLPGTVTQVSAGYLHTCAVSSGKSYCWGSNTAGQLGNNSTTNSNVYVTVRANAGDQLYQKTVTDITATTEETTCAVANGEAYCWGAGYFGQLGNNGTSNSSLAVKVYTSGQLNGKYASHVIAGYYHVCAVAEGQVYCWGHGSQGQLGNGRDYGTSGTDYNSTVPVKAINTF